MTSRRMNGVHYTTIVTGPKGCGKQANGERIARAYGMDGIVASWQPGDAITEGKLHLTNKPVVREQLEVEYQMFLRVVSYDTAMQMVAIEESPV